MLQSNGLCLITNRKEYQRLITEAPTKLAPVALSGGGKKKQTHNNNRTMIPTVLNVVAQRNSYRNPRCLGEDYLPSNYDVLCGKGKAAANHIGNQRFKVTISIYVRRYRESASRSEKTAIVAEVMDLVRQNSPGGGFVKYDQHKGTWYEVGDNFAREKVSQAFRDSLHDRYESSKASKRLKRQAAKTMLQSSLHSFDSLFATSASEESSGEISESKKPRIHVQDGEYFEDDQESKQRYIDNC